MKTIGLRGGVIRLVYAIFVFASAIAASANAQTLPPGWTTSNVGNPAISGSAAFTAGTFTISGAGADVGGSSDQFTFVQRQIAGDTTFIARVETLQNISGWSKAGVMIRESLAAGSKYAFAHVTPSHGVAFLRRTTTGGSSSQTNGGSGTAPVWLKLERRSTTVTAFRSTNGTTWTQIGSTTVSMTSTVYVGLAVTSRDAIRAATATFTNVSEALPSGWTATDIGGPTVAGSTQYASANGAFTLKGSGEIGGTADRFHFAYRQMSGDLDIRARVVSVQNIQPWSKAGVMIRETLNADAVNGLMFISGVSGSAFHQRRTTGGMREATAATAVAPPYWVRLERRGSLVTGSQSSNGVTWTTVGTMTLSSPAIYVGLAVASSDNSLLTTAVVDNVAVTVPSSNQPPAISLTAPTNGATFTAPASIGLAATASDADGTIVQVAFYAGSTLLTTDTSSPYAYTWNGVAAGSYSLTAVAQDNAGATTTSAARTVTVSASSNQPPAVSLTAPANGATFSAGATIAVGATASDTDGTIAAVEFYAGTTLIGTDASSPYSVNWSNVPSGTHALTAVAQDDDGARTTSAARTVTVAGGGGMPSGWTATDIGGPTVAGSTQYASANGAFTLKGSGEIGGTADRFHFAYRQMSGDLDIRARVVSVQNIQPWSKAGVMIRETLNADAVNGLMFISGVSGSAFHQRRTTGGMREATAATAVAPPYWVRLERRGSLVTGSQSSNGVTWTTVGTMTLSSPAIYVGLAVASSDNSLLTTAVVDNVAVTVPSSNQPPAISLTAPTNGATFTAPASIGLAATASDADGTIVQVAFYAGSTLLTTDTSSPYAYTWNGVAAGSYSLTAVAQDNAGATTTSAARTVTVSASSNQPPAISLTAPANGAVYTAPASFTVTANASDADGSVTRVEFWSGSTLIGSDTTSPYAAPWNNVPAGSYPLVAVAWDNAGAMTVSGTRDIRVDPAALPRTAIFTASANHATAVDRYFLEIFPAGANPLVANPVATRDIGKPAVVAGEIQVDVSQTTTALPSGSYIATVTAIGAGGSARSAASPTFVR